MLPATLKDQEKWYKGYKGSLYYFESILLGKYSLNQMNIPMKTYGSYTYMKW